MRPRVAAQPQAILADYRRGRPHEDFAGSGSDTCRIWPVFFIFFFELK